jgi:predicted SnoaL-like aldol condensation-catalyzing enzyme
MREVGGAKFESRRQFMTSATTVGHAIDTAEQLDANRSMATEFLAAAASGHALEAMDRYAAPDFVHHNPYFPSDARSLATAMDDNARANPNKSLEVLRTIAEGQLVAVHSRVRQGPAEPPAPVVHILRFEDGHIREFWDIGQDVPLDSPNEAGPF